MPPVGSTRIAFCTPCSRSTPTRSGRRASAWAAQSGVTVTMALSPIMSMWWIPSPALLTGTSVWCGNAK